MEVDEAQQEALAEEAPTRRQPTRRRPAAGPPVQARPSLQHPHKLYRRQPEPLIRASAELPGCDNTQVSYKFFRNPLAEAIATFFPRDILEAAPL